MTPNKDWFDSYTSYDFDFIYIGKAYAIAWEGKIKIQMHNDVQTFYDVKHVPKLKKNLISLSTLHVNSFGYKTDENYSRVSKSAMIVMKKKRAKEISTSW